MRRRGLTLVEILIAMAILAALAAVLYPAVGVQLRRGQTTAIANQVTALKSAIDNYRSQVLRYPSSLTQLTVQPVAGAVDLCGTAIPAANRNAWRGPYLSSSVVGNMPVGDAILSNAIVRAPPTTAVTQVGELELDFNQVDTLIFADLERDFDGNNNPNTGSITWAVTGLLKYNMQIRGC